MHHPTDRITHTTAFVTPVMEHWLEREITQWVHPMKDRSDDPSHHERTLLPYFISNYMEKTVCLFVCLEIFYLMINIKNLFFLAVTCNHLFILYLFLFIYLLYFICCICLLFVYYLFIYSLFLFIYLLYLFVVFVYYLFIIYLFILYF